MFKNERLVVWEYVVNELEYVDSGTSPVVKVRLDGKNRKITISGNGRGMPWAGEDGLEHFFLMHGENPDRRAGRPGRGFFGTGKSAAFGIADVLRITTVRAGKRSKVELRRSDLVSAASGDPVPVRTLEREQATTQPNGTIVEIEGIHLRSLDQAGVVNYIERHLAHWPKDATVLVNNHECEFAEPPISEVYTYPAESPLAGSTLTIKVSKSPLDQDLRGVSLLSGGVWHETTLLTSNGKEMAEFIFGEIDVPALATDDSTPSPFDASRSMSLNPDNPLVGAIYGFVGPRIEEVRKRLAEAQREQRATEESKRLRREASQIEAIINSDFDAFRKRLQKVKTTSAESGPDTGETPDSGSDGEDDFLFGGDEPAGVTEPTGEPGGDHEGEGGHGGGGLPRRLNPIVEPAPGGDARGHYEGNGADRPKRRGGFHIEFANQGQDSARAVYQAENRTIYINLDHPQIAAAKISGSVGDPTFRRLAYEVAFFEYSIALASELDNRGEYIDPSDPIVDIRETINRVARQAASLYA
jgi:hypothetical protein